MIRSKMRGFVSARKPRYPVVMADDDRKLDPPLRFDAVLAPHRSLSGRGFLVLMAVVVAVNFAAGMLFLLKGAWPVFGFCGLDVALVYWAFRTNYRAARAHETVQLSDEELRIRRVDAKGRARGWSFQPYWVRLEEVAYPDETKDIYVVSHGRALEVAHCLSQPERLDFARALGGALARLKAPRKSQ